MSAAIIAFPNGKPLPAPPAIDIPSAPSTAASASTGDTPGPSGFTLRRESNGDLAAFSPGLNVYVDATGGQAHLHEDRMLWEVPHMKGVPRMRTVLVAYLGAMRVAVYGREIVVVSGDGHGLIRDGYIAYCAGGLAGGSRGQATFFSDGIHRAYLVASTLIVTRQDLKL